MGLWGIWLQWHVCFSERPCPFSSTNTERKKEKTFTFLWCNRSLKEKVEFWEEVKINLWVLSLLLRYARVEEHQIKHVPWKVWLFKYLYILNMACNIVKIGTDFYATCSCSPIHPSVYSAWTLPRLGQNSYHFDDSRTLPYTHICQMINLFWSIPHHFFHNAVAWQELNFIFNSVWFLVKT